MASSPRVITTAVAPTTSPNAPHSWIASSTGLSHCVRGNLASGQHEPEMWAIPTEEESPAMPPVQYPIEDLIDKNRRWSNEQRAADPNFFEALCGLQTPRYLWIGCSDSRVPANEIVGLKPGELFVHRNVANIVVPGDSNCLSVLQYAADVLGVQHIIVCGHYGCGGVQAAMTGEVAGALGHWLDSIHRVYQTHRADLEALPDMAERVNRLCELNILEQVKNVADTTTVRTAWRNGRALAIHGWVYDLHDGLVRQLLEPVTGEIPD